MLFEELLVSSYEIKKQKDNSKLQTYHTERCKTLTKVVLMEIDEISSSQDQQYIYNHMYNTDRDYLASIVYKIQHDPTYHPFIQELAEEAYMTPNAFCQAFKRRFGTTPLQYAISFRIIHASRLLIETAMNIKDIASLLGYTDPQSFGRQFLKHMKKTPTQFRNENIPKK
jgi:AraC-like DNA-binding protein